VIEFIRLAARGLGRRVRTPSVPRLDARVAARVLAEALTRAGPRDHAPRAGGVLEMLTRHNPFTSDRARRELGWSPAVDPAVTVPEAFAWWAEERLMADG
jgi:hypothetical protein